MSHGNSPTSPKVLIVLGSASDWPVMKEAYTTLTKFGVPTEVRVQSAHRTPDEAAQLAKTAADQGIRVIIAAAGMAAHLPGVLASHTTLPVLGVPMAGGILDGLDALLAIVQMPAGIPVGTLAVGKAGAVNAALLAVEILALGDEALRKALLEHKARLRESVERGNEEIRKELGQS
jgi:5-(carboxyamino)imidazole ribonucleotide mutase